MGSKKWVGKLGWVLLLAGVVFLGQGWRSPRPARAADPLIKIMPLGDSITSGTDAAYSVPMSSYRCELYNKLLAAGYSFNFVGSVHGQWGNLNRSLTPPGPPGYCGMVDWDEEGHSGWSTIDILIGAIASWPGKLSDWAAAEMPDIVLIHLGTIDLVNAHYTPEDTAGRIGQIIDTLRAANPRVRIVLAQIIPGSSTGVTGTETATIPLFNALLPALVASKAQPYSPIVLVDMHTNFFIKDHTLDGIHPNPNGENKIAGRWKIGIEQIMKINYWTFVPLVVK
jgi:acyl-CoA thioesterase-1